MYRGDTVINAPVQFVRRFVMDPLIISGISGHISILGFKDKAKNEFLFGDRIRELSAPANEFKALFILLKRGSNFKYADGVFKGPEVTMDGIKYSGYSDDGKLEFEISFIPKSLGENLTRMYFATNVKYNDSFMDRLLGRSAVNFARHIVEDHFITYTKVYFSSFADLLSSMGQRDMSSPSSVSLSPISEFTGDAGSLLAKMNEVMSQLNLGVIKMSFDKLNCSIVVENKTMKKAMCKSDKEIRTGLEAISMIITTATKGQGKMQVYTINVEDLIESLAVLA